MKFTFATDLASRKRTDLLVLPFWQEGKKAADFHLDFQEVIKLGDFKGKLGETLILYPQKNEKEERICLLGLGPQESLNEEALRRAYAEAVKVAQNKKAPHITLLPPKTDRLSVTAMGEGVLLANYRFAKLKGSTKENVSPLLQEVCWIGVSQKKELEKAKIIAEGVYFVRDLVNGNADEVTPKMMSETSLSLKGKIKVKVLDKKQLEKEKMGLILAVSRASSYDPFLVEVSYQGNPRSKEQIVLVGKGVTYDTGGLALKPVDSMMSMKCDMSGAATVLGAVKVAEELGLKVNVTAVLPLAENALGSKSYKHGDVYRSANGKTVEITNTDAEGRLILADAMSYALKYLKPTCMIDVASLTGSIVVGLGDEIAGLFTDDEALSQDLMSASKKTGELIWPIPIHKDYGDSLRSDIADLVNASGRDGGAIKAALFLKEFAGSISWAHLDIAGPCYLSKPKRYFPTKATGFGVRLLVDFLEKRSV